MSDNSLQKVYFANVPGWSRNCCIKVMKRILIIDDNEQLLSVVREFLGMHGYEVHTATEQEEAEAMLNNIEYDLVITDLALTRFGLGGLDILQRLSHYARRPKVIVLTGHGGADVQTEAHSRGVDAFVKKPAPLTELVRLVGSMVEA